MTARARTLTLGGTAYPLILPNIRDPRLHVASVIITIHVLGQIGLGFAVSVPQILAAILTSAVIEVVLTFRQAKAFVWPASAMLTGSGVALILRVVGTAPNDHWTTYAWEVFAVVAALSLLSKYVIRYRGSHVFNPSNIGLVVTFLVLGVSRVEPLDFWWAPLTPWMLLAYAVILTGGLLITRRLALLTLAAAFWVTLAAGLGLLAASGHCMIANWAFAPVCGADFVRVIVTSPEVMIFLFFMITDPKTVPTGQVSRAVFGVVVGVTCVLLMAPQTDEFGTKVGLLAGLVLVCAARPLLERFLPEPKSAADDLRRFVRGLFTGGAAAPRLAAVAGRALVAALAVAVVGAGVVLAGTPARTAGTSDPTELLNRLPRQVDPATLPVITVGQDVATYDPTLVGDGIRQVAVTLAQNLELERVALLRRDGSILPAIAHGDRLAELQRRLADAGTGGPITVERYRFDTIDASLILPFGAQTGLVLGLTATGTVTHETHDAGGAVVGTTSEPFRLTFAMRRATGARWLNVGVLRPEDVQRP